MIKALVILSTLAVFILGVCGVKKEEANQTQAREEQKAPKEMNTKDLPQVTAFQDEATREYMVSTKEVELGYYLLESKNKRFRMIFPDKGKVILSRSSYISENEESIGFNSYDEDNNILFDGKVTYYKGHSFVQDIEVMLEINSGKNDYTGEYHNEENNNNIYLASKKYTFDNIDRKYNFTYGYFGIVKFEEEEDEGIEFSFSYSCKDDDKACNLEEGETKNSAKKIIESISFLSNGKE